MEKLITIVVPNFNNEKYIVKCIKSIQEQTYKNLEILIIDDKSTDSSREVITLLAAADDRIRPVFNETNLGVSANRHKGIVVSKGNYISTLDSDDYLYNSSKIKCEYEVMSLAKQNSILAFSNYILVGKSDAPLEHQDDRPMKDGDLFSCILSRSCKIPRDFMFTKEQYIQSGGLNMSLKMYEDWDLKIRMSSRYDFVYSGLNGIAYRRHQSGLSAVKRHVHYKWLMKIYNANVNIFSDRIDVETRNSFEEFVKNNFNYRHKLLSLFVR